MYAKHLVKVKIVIQNIAAVALLLIIYLKRNSMSTNFIYALILILFNAKLKIGIT